MNCFADINKNDKNMQITAASFEKVNVKRLSSKFPLEERQA
jgi:hypothetical protein